MGRRGPNWGKCIALHQTYHWLSSIAFRFICHYNKKRLKPLKNEEQKMEFCVFSSTFCHSRQLRVWLWNLRDAIPWAIIKWNWSAWVYNINTTQKKHATQTTDNTHKFATIISWFCACKKYTLKYCIKNVILYQQLHYSVIAWAELGVNALLRLLCFP